MTQGMVLALLAVVCLLAGPVSAATLTVHNMTDLRPNQVNSITLISDQSLTMTMFTPSADVASAALGDVVFQPLGAAINTPLVFSANSGTGIEQTLLVTPTTPGPFTLMLTVFYADTDGNFGNAAIPFSGTVLNGFSTTESGGVTISDYHQNNMTVNLLVPASVIFNVTSNISVSPSTLTFDASSTGHIQLYSAAATIGQVTFTPIGGANMSNFETAVIHIPVLAPIEPTSNLQNMTIVRGRESTDIELSLPSAESVLLNIAPEDSTQVQTSLTYLTYVNSRTAAFRVTGLLAGAFRIQITPSTASEASAPFKTTYLTGVVHDPIFSPLIGLTQVRTPISFTGVTDGDLIVLQRTDCTNAHQAITGMSTLAKSSINGLQVNALTDAVASYDTAFFRCTQVS